MNFFDGCVRNMEVYKVKAGMQIMITQPSSIRIHLIYVRWSKKHFKFKLISLINDFLFEFHGFKPRSTVYFFSKFTPENVYFTPVRYTFRPEPFTLLGPHTFKNHIKKSPYTLLFRTVYFTSYSR